MSSPERIYHGTVRTMSALMIGLGLVIVVRTLAGGGGPLSVGLVIGLAFIGVGVARLYLSSRTRR